MTMETAFTVRELDLERFDEQEAVSVFRDLLWAEASRVGIPLSKITVSLRTKVGDKGVDASVQSYDALGVSNIILEGQNSYQIKAGKTFKPWQKAQIRNEVFGRGKDPIRANLKEGIRKCLENDGIYIVVCFGHDLTHVERTDAKDHLKAFLGSCGYQNPRIDVWGVGQLIGFLRHFPSLSLRVTGRLGGARFETHDGWSTNEDMKKAFVAGEDQDRLIGMTRDALRDTEAPHVRVCGPAGIGKTKLVLEATRADDLRPLVAYFYSASTFLQSDFFYEIMREDDGFATVIVVDECDPGDHAILLNKLKHYGLRCRLVTIYSDYERPQDVTLVEVPPLDDVQISEILENQYAIPKDHAGRWAKVCDGYPRIAHMVGWNLINNPEDILQPPSTNRVWERFIAGGDHPDSEVVRQRRVVLHYLALFKRFGYGSKVRTEAKTIANIIRTDEPAITWPKFQRIVKQLRERKILQGENTLYITPKLLHIKLWIDWWELYGDLAEISDLLSNAPPPLLDWFFEMFEYAAGSEAASKTVQELLSPVGPFQQNPELLKTDRGARFFRILGEVEPESAVRCLQNTIGRWSVDELHDFTEGRRHIVWLLEKTAAWRHLFSDSAHLLLALAEAENETWSNNASGVFAELFTVSRHPKLSVTEAPPQERFPVIEEALQAETKERRLLAIKACDYALQERRSGTVSSDVHVFGTQPDPWLPKTYGELFDVHRRAWRLLSESLATLAADERDEAVEALLRNMRRLGVRDNFVDMVMDTVEQLLSRNYVDERKILEVAIQIRRFDRGGLSDDVRRRWQELEDRLTGSDFASLVKRYVGMSLVEDSYDEHGNRVNKVRSRLKELAQEAVENPPLLYEELPWLVTESAVNGTLFGYLVAQHDTDFSLLQNILEAQRSAPPGSGAFFSGGYLRALFEQDEERWEDLLDSFAADKQMQLWVPDFTWRAATLTDRAAQRLLELADQKVIDINVFSMFRYGDATHNLSEDMFRAWIEFLLASPSRHAIYIAIVLHDQYYLHEDSAVQLPDELTFRLLTHNTLFLELPENLRQGGLMESYHWDRIARAFIKHYPQRSIELAQVIIEHFNKEKTIFADRHHGPQAVLATIIKMHPEAVWEELKEHFGPPRTARAYSLGHWLRGRTGFSGEEQDEGMLPAIPPHLVWEWVESDVEERAWYLAHFVPKGLHRDQETVCWARELLIRYGHREDVRNELMANFSTEGWTGPASLHYQRKKESLLSFRQDEENENVRHWIDEYVEYLDRRIEHARLNEERREF